MSQAIVTPSEVRSFAGSLDQFNKELKNKCSMMHGRFRHLGETWRDQEYKKFEQEFNQTIKTINQFLGISEKYVPFLHQKAAMVEQYLHKRL